MLTERESYSVLSHYEGIARERGFFAKPCGRSMLNVRPAGDGDFEYQWGGKPVEKRIALTAVRMFVAEFRR
jgi:hypothetical protein